MNHSKKLVALLTALAMTMSLLCITSFATGETTTIMTDDFDSYYLEANNVSGLTGTGGGRYVAKTDENTYATTWYAASYFGTNNDDLAGIVLDPTDSTNTEQVLAIEGNTHYYNKQKRPRVVYQNMSANNIDSYTYKFDFYKGNENAGGGIIFNYDGGNTSVLQNSNYYMLNFVGKNNYSYGYNTTSNSELFSSVIVRNNDFQRDVTVVTTNNETTGMGDYEGTNFYGSSTNTFTTTGNDYLPAQTWFSVALTYCNGAISWTVKDRATQTVVQTGNWTDPDPVLANPAGFALHSAGNNTANTNSSPDDNFMYFDNVSVERTAMPRVEVDSDGVYTYDEIFSAYDEDDGAVGTSAVTVRADKADRTILKNDAGSWKLSDVHSGQGFPGAYISADNEVLYLLGHQGVNSVTKDMGDSYYPAVVNFDPAGTGSVELKELTVKGAKYGTSRFGIRIAVSEDEQSYYEFGRGDWYDTIDETGYPKYAPYVVKCVNGSRTMVDYSTDETAINDENSRTWTVAVNSTSITVSVTSAENDSVTYEYTLTDTDGLLEKSAYPLALYSSAGASFDGINIKYLPHADVFVDGGSGTATVTVVPARYLKTGDSLNVVTAFYDANDGFISASETAVTTAGSHNVETPANYSYAKVMMYDGTSLVKEISTKEETVTTSRDKTVIACVGDDNTGNYSSTTSDTWSTRFAAMLGGNYDVQNYGRAGCSLINGIKAVYDDDGNLSNNPSYTLSKEYSDSLASNPDIVIIMLGTNDGDISDTTKRATFKSDYISLIESYQSLETSPKVILAVPPIRGTADSPNTNSDEVREVIQEISQAKDLRYVDMSNLITDYDLLHDELTFTEAGYAQFAEHFYNAVKKNVTSSVSDDKQSVVINSDASFSSDIAVAVYKDGVLTGVEFVDNATVLSASAHTVNVSALDIANGDKVKVMIFDDKISPYTYAQTISNKTAYVSNGDALITGNTTPNARVGVTVYNGENLVYADTANADRSGYYEFIPALSAGTYIVNTTAGIETTLTVE